MSRQFYPLIVRRFCFIQNLGLESTGPTLAIHRCWKNPVYRVLKNRIKILEAHFESPSIIWKKMDQYSRRNSVVVDSISSSVKKKELKGKCIEVLGKIDIKIYESVIEACHRLGKSTKAMISFVKRLFCSIIMAKKSELSDIEKKRLKKIELLETVKLFFWSNLSLSNEEISFNSGEVKRKGHTCSSWFSSGSVSIHKKCRTDEKSIEVHHLNQLPRLFTDLKFMFQEIKQD